MDDLLLQSALVNDEEMDALDDMLRVYVKSTWGSDSLQ